MPVKVIIVDDEKISREYIRNLIDWEANGFILIDEAQNATDAMSILKNNDVDIVLLDVYMPGENGTSLSKKIAENYPFVAMIAISSYDNYDFVRDILKNGAHDYILKHRLTREVLLSALQLTVRKLNMKQDSVDEGNLRFRNKVEDWLFGFGSNPYHGYSGRIVVTFASAVLASNIPDELIYTITNGILDALEEDSNPEHMITAVKHLSNNFVILSKFESMISEAEILREVYLCNIKSKNNIKLIYNIEFDISGFPILMEYNKIPKMVQKYITKPSLLVKPKKKLERARITMTIAQQKQLLIALDEQNEQSASSLIKEIYTEIPNNNIRAKLFITKELLEILMMATKEYEVQTDLILNDKKIFEWVQNLDNSELCIKMIKLYAVVIQAQIEQQGFSEYIISVKKFIDENYMKDIRLSDVAEHVGVSQPYLSKIYKEETGMTFIESLNRVRIEAAKDCLKNGMPIKEVAPRCGFQKYNYFFRVFKNYEGVTPKQYKNRKHIKN